MKGLADYSLKCAALVLIVVSVFVIPAVSQTADEKTALKKLGAKGFVVYEHKNTIYKYVLDGTGEVTLQKLVEAAQSPSVSQDGAYITYMKSDNLEGTSKNCFIWVMRSDGTDKRQLNTTALPYVGGTNFDNKNNIIFTTGPITVRPTENMSQQLWSMDVTGNNKTMLLDYGGVGTSSYMYISHYDRHDDWVTWRWNARAYVGLYKGTAKLGSYGSVKDIGQRCGNCFNPTGDQLTINSIDHKSVTIYTRSTTTWTASTTIVKSAQQHTNMRWSNLQKWMLMRKEEGDANCYAVNMENIAERVKITFSDSTHSPNLFIGDLTTTSNSFSRTGFSLSPVSSRPDAAFTIDGRALVTPASGFGVRLNRMANSRRSVLLIQK